MNATETSVKLKTVDGKEIEVPLNKLSEQDQEYVRDLLAQYKAMVGDFPIGTTVEIKSGSRWYLGKVLQVQPGKYFVSFDDYSDSWNKWLTSSELRLPVEVVPPTKSEPETDASVSVPQPMAGVPIVNADETVVPSPTSSNIVTLTLEPMPESPLPYEHRFTSTNEANWILTASRRPPFPQQSRLQLPRRRSAQLIFGQYNEC